MTASTGRESDKFMLRLPDGMRERIADEARANNRSMNAEIVARLTQTLSPTGAPHPTFEEAVAAHGGDVQALLASETTKLRELLERIERSQKKKRRTRGGDA